jgi:hypothetical protein
MSDSSRSWSAILNVSRQRSVEPGSKLSPIWWSKGVGRIKCSDVFVEGTGLFSAYPV